MPTSRSVCRHPHGGLFGVGLRGLIVLLVAGCKGAAPPAVKLDEVAFRDVVRPMLQRVGCASGSCHGSGLIGLRLGTSGQHPDDFAQVAKHVIVDDPARSPLREKARGAVPHLGGRNVGGCEEELLAAWIRGRPLPRCPEPPARAWPAPLPSEIAPLLDGCATASCHGGPASPRLLASSHVSPGDRFAIAPEHLSAALRVDGEALAPFADRVQPSRSRLLALLGGGDRTGRGHPRSTGGVGDRRWRAWFAWMAGDPILDEATLARAPFERFAREVQPILERRGCALGSCHGASGSTLPLLGGAAADNWLRLVARRDTFTRKAANAVPHGGGRRLGGDEDCAAVTVRAWLDGRVPGPCAPRPPPDPRVFAEVVQPSLEALTCPRCHDGGDLEFHFVARPDGAALERNYREVLARIDLDYPPVSSVLLRVHEDCMQARILAWIAGAPDPACTVSIKNFKGRFPTR